MGLQGRGIRDKAGLQSLSKLNSLMTSNMADWEPLSLVAVQLYSPGRLPLTVRMLS